MDRPESRLGARGWTVGSACPECMGGNRTVHCSNCCRCDNCRQRARDAIGREPRLSETTTNTPNRKETSRDTHPAEESNPSVTSCECNADVTENLASGRHKNPDTTNITEPKLAPKGPCQFCGAPWDKWYEHPEPDGHYNGHWTCNTGAYTDESVEQPWQSEVCKEREAIVKWLRRGDKSSMHGASCLYLADQIENGEHHE